MTDYSDSINQQYGRPSLYTSILDAFKSEGIESNRLTLDDLSKFDQLHNGGRRATRTLANLAGIKPGMEVLDIGCGVGGPARTLANEFGCQVTGIDLTEDYIMAAQGLTDRVGLSDSVRFLIGNALNLEFYNDTFDIVWSQNAIMNIEDKRQMVQEAHRVLRSNGIFALEAIIAGEKEETLFPVYWADNPAVSFLIPSDSFRQLMEEIGFIEIVWKDVTEQAIELIYKAQTASQNEELPVGLHLLYTKIPEKAKNTLQGFEDGTYMDIYAVYKRST